jgi:hypothetical protein
MFPVRVVGPCGQPLSVHASEDVYWTVFLSVCLLSVSGIYTALSLPIDDGLQWAFVVLFLVHFVSAIHNQSYFWNVYTSVMFSSDTQVTADLWAEESNAFIGIMLIFDRLVGCALFILTVVFWEDLKCREEQAALLCVAFIFYLLSWATYINPPLFHTHKKNMTSPGQWYSITMLFFHLTLTVLILSLL